MKPSKTLMLLTPNELTEARNWLSGCEFAEAEFLAGEDRAEFFANMTERAVLRGVERHYEGGLHAFVVATGMRKVVTRAEWAAKHDDYKLSADQSMSGMPMMLEYDPKHGTCLVPVVIVPQV